MKNIETIMTLRLMKFLLAIVVVAAFVFSGAPVIAEASASDKETTMIAATSDEDDVKDPLERMNRAIFGFNECKSSSPQPHDFVTRNLLLQCHVSISNC